MGHLSLTVQSQALWASSLLPVSYPSKGPWRELPLEHAWSLSLWAVRFLSFNDRPYHDYSA